MKLRELIRNKKLLKQTLRHQKRKNNPENKEPLDVMGDGTGDNVNRGMNNNEGYI